MEKNNNSDNIITLNDANIEKFISDYINTLNLKQPITFNDYLNSKDYDHITSLDVINYDPIKNAGHYILFFNKQSFYNSTDNINNNNILYQKIEFDIPNLLNNSANNTGTIYYVTDVTDLSNINNNLTMWINIEYKDSPNFYLDITFNTMGKFENTNTFGEVSQFDAHLFRYNKSV